jgi:hypothetical protein
MKMSAFVLSLLGLLIGTSLVSFAAEPTPHSPPETSYWVFPRQSSSEWNAWVSAGTQLAAH